MDGLELSTVITYNPFSVSAQATIDDAARMLENSEFHHLPVVDDQQRMVGIVSDYDVLRALQARQTAALAVADGVAAATEPAVQFVEEVMSRRIITIDHRDSPKKALQMLTDHDFHSLPVLEDDQLVAIVTTTDFLREFSYGALEFSRDSVVEHMTPQIPTLDVSASLDQAKATFLAEDARYLAVMDGDFPLGVVARREVRRAKYLQLTHELLGESSPETGPASLADLVRQVPMVQPGCAMFEATAKMLAAQIQAVVVVNRACRWLGGVTEDAILKAMLYYDLTE